MLAPVGLEGEKFIMRTRQGHSERGGYEMVNFRGRSTPLKSAFLLMLFEGVA